MIEFSFFYFAIKDVRKKFTVLRKGLALLTNLRKVASPSCAAGCD